MVIRQKEKNLIMFLSGVFVGFATSYILVKLNEPVYEEPVRECIPEEKPPKREETQKDICDRNEDWKREFVERFEHYGASIVNDHPSENASDFEIIGEKEAGDRSEAGFDCEFLTYYKGDEVLADEEEYAIDTIDTIGVVGLNYIQTAHPSVFIVCDNGTRTMYEVTCVDDSWSSPRNEDNDEGP